MGENDKVRSFRLTEEDQKILSELSVLWGIAQWTEVVRHALKYCRERTTMIEVDMLQLERASEEMKRLVRRVRQLKGLIEE